MAEASSGLQYQASTLRGGMQWWTQTLMEHSTASNMVYRYILTTVTRGELYDFLRLVTKVSACGILVCKSC